MRVLNAILAILTIWILTVGLWDHDWRQIAAGATMAVIYPVIRKDIARTNPPHRAGCICPSCQDRVARRRAS